MKVSFIFALLLSLVLLQWVDATGVKIQGQLLSRDQSTKAVYVNSALATYTASNNTFAFMTAEKRGTLTFRTLPTPQSPVKNFEVWETWSFVVEGPAVTYRLVKPGVVWEKEIHAHERLEVKPVGVKPYFMQREGFSPLGMLMNPMVLMMLVSVGLMVFMQVAMPQMQQQQQEAAEVK